MKKLTLTIILMALVISSSYATTWYVDGTNGNDANAGDNWGTNNAKATIQAGINAASTGDTVLVKYETNGTTYNITSSIDFGGKNIKLASDDGNHDSYDTAVKNAEKCIINAGNSCIIFYFHSSETSDAVVDRFTIQNGNAPGGYPYDGGGGIHCRGNSSPTIQNNAITGNSGPDGGGIYCGDNSSPTIQNNTITGNSADNYGGGIYCGGNSSPTIQNNTITGNSSYRGGGINCDDDSSPLIQNNTISNNLSSNGSGGGIYISNNSSPRILNNTIAGNSAQSAGGILCKNSNVRIDNNTITGNSADESGGGISCANCSPAVVAGNAITENSAGLGGGGIYLYNAHPNIILNTITGNVTGYQGGGGIYCNSSSPNIDNNIISKNLTNLVDGFPGDGGGIYCTNSSSPKILNNTITGNQRHGIICRDNSSPTVINTIIWGSTYGISVVTSNPIVTYSNVQGGYSGEGNINMDPEFENLGSGDYHLKDSSPCIGAGTVSWTQSNDIEGNPRPNPAGSNPDIGAYENPLGLPDDGDGVPDNEEKGPDGNNPNYDGNNDGTPDCQQNNTASLHTNDDSYYVTLACTTNNEMAGVQAIENPSPDDTPTGADFPYEFFDFSVENVSVGGTTTVTLYLPEGESPDTYYKYGPTPGNTTDHWYEFMYDSQTGAQINENEITLHFVDGLRGDDDLTQNGTVEDEGAPAFAQSLSPVVSSSQTAGQSFTVDIQAEDVTDLFGVSFELTYDTTYIDATAVSYDSNLLGSDLVTTENIDDDNGIVGIGVSQKSGAGGVSDTGMVAHVTFTSTAQGGGFSESVTFNLQTLDAIDSAGASITMELGNASVTLEGNNTPTALATDISGAPSAMYAGKSFTTLTSKYSDADGYADLDDLKLTLDNGSNDIVLVAAGGDTGTGLTATIEGSSDWVNSATYDRTSSGNDIDVTWNITLDWDWTESTQIDFIVRATDVHSASSTPDTKDANVKYENDLTFSGTLAASGSTQGSLNSGDWVKGGETITWIGLTVVYEGSAVAPSESDFNIKITDDDDGSWTQTAGTSLNLQTTADPATDTGDIHNIDIISIPTGGSDVSTETWTVKVDADAPTNAGLNTPVNGATGVSITPTLTVLTATDSDSDLAASPYYFELATDTGFTQNTQNSGFVANPQWSPTLSGGTTYYWRVKTKDAVGNESVLAGHTADTSGYGSFTTTPPPTVTGIEPASGSIYGSTDVTITGSNFQNSATVTIGGNDATNVQFSNSNTLTATTPAGSAGTADVVVTNPDNQSDTLSGGFTYLMPVWPGDTDNDGDVDQNDVTPLGVHWGETETVRTNASIQWNEQLAQAWTTASTTYVDANGNGTINQGDVLPIGFNFGETHTVPPAAPTHIIIDEGTTLPPLRAIAPSVIKPGENFAVKIQVGDTDMPVDGLFGIAFRLQNQRPQMVQAVKATPDSLLGNNLVFFQHIDEDEGHVSVGMTKKRGQEPVQGNGTVANIGFVASEKAELGSKVTLAFTDAAVNNPTCERILVNAQSTDFVIGYFGDVTCDAKIDASDAREVLQMMVSRSSSYEKGRLADASGDGIVSPFDAALILQRSEELRSSLPAEVDDTAIVPELLSQPQMSIPAVDGKVGKNISVPVEVDVAGLMFGQMNITFDSRLLRVQSVIQGEMIRTGELAHRVEDNQLHIAFANLKAVEGKGILFNIDFEVTNSPGMSSDASFTLTWGQLNDVVLPVQSMGRIHLLPSETRLLHNYPNPFNPETWIPYQLATDASDISLVIYNIGGQIVRTLRLDSRPAGMYLNKERAAHWDGRNQQGERVASGIYIYHFRASDYQAIRKMVIWK